jgi:ATP-dependent Clp protease, protease subunit
MEKAPIRPRFDEEDEPNDEAKPPVEQGVEPMIQKKLVAERKVFFWTDTNDEACRKAVEKLLYLEAVDPGKEITFYLNSPGGSITSGMALYDTMRMLTSPLKIVVMGMAASMGSILLCAGSKGRRFIFPHARVLIHQPLISGSMSGSAVDINIQAIEMERLRSELNQILADSSGQPIEKIQHDTDRDFYMTAKEAIAYGLADGIVDKI